MARVEVIRTEPTPPPIEEVVLHLSEKAAMTLYSLLGRLSLTATLSERGESTEAISSIYGALGSVLPSYRPYGPSLVNGN